MHKQVCLQPMHIILVCRHGKTEKKIEKKKNSGNVLKIYTEEGPENLV